MSVIATRPGRQGEAMEIDEAARRRLIRTVAEAVIEHADELTVLDQAIGDGDHGLNMKRGFEAVLADLDRLAAQPLPEAVHEVGMVLVMHVGGASGPLFGTLLLQLGSSLPERPNRADLAAAFAVAVAAVKARGRSDAGSKTLLDVLVPVQAALAEGDPAELPALADAAAAATVPMQALRGRASFLGARSIGHLDPGARSAALMVRAAYEALAAGA